MKIILSQSIQIFSYLDDWLIVASTFEVYQTYTITTLQIVKKFRFVINEEKSRLIPSQCLRWLAWRWNTALGNLSIPLDRQLEVGKICEKFQNLKSFTKLQIQSLLGLLNCVCTIEDLSLETSNNFFIDQTLNQMDWVRDYNKNGKDLVVNKNRNCWRDKNLWLPILPSFKKNLCYWSFHRLS